jgi:hypothetical protein
MSRGKVIVVLLLLLSGKGFSQSPDILLEKWSALSPIEKIYLHFDRENYLAGETAWFKAYLYSDYQPDTISTTLYVELLKDSTTVISRSIVPVLLGSSNGQIDLPDSLGTGHYQVRAYTITMLNQGTDFLYKRSIFIYGKNKIQATASAKLETKMRMEFFPEGGQLVQGFTNTVAFKAVGKDGMPVAVSGTIRNDKNEEQASFTTYHDGMGMFELTPVAGVTYHAIVTGDVAGVQYLLPSSTDKGIALSIIPHPQGNFFEVKQQKNNAAFQVAYMVGQMQHHVVFRQNFATGKEQLQGVINTQNLHSGILQVTFFNKDNMPLAERLCFVNNKEYLLPATIKEDTIDFSERAKNKFSLQFQDTVQGSFSISITDNEYSQLPQRQESIFTSLLLTSDIKGYLNNPAYYFSADNDSVQTALDLVMMTNGWRRFNWQQLLSNPVSPTGYKDNRYITLAGKANLQGTKKPFDNKQLLLFIVGANKKRTTQFLQTDAQGNFRLDSMIFFDKTRLLFSDVRGKKSQYIDIVLNGDSVRRVFPLLPMLIKPYTISQIETNTRWKMDYEAIQKAKGQMLEEVKLKVKKKSPMQQVEDNYTSGLFSGDATKAIDLVNSDEAVPYQNIFEYLQSRVNGLQVTADGFDYTLIYRQGASASSMGMVPMTLFLDEIETDASVIATIPANQVALVKVYNSFAGAWGNAPGGVLAVYTKKGQDYKNSSSSFTNNQVYNGYSVIKEFYSPDYKTEQAEKKPDNRITLLWRPSVFINSINPVLPIPFYNNDRTKQFRIVVEGLTMDGKMLSIEKIINADKKGF